MGNSELKMVLEVLSRAISRETAAFNYYFKQSRDTSLPKGVRGLLTKLSEEERQHRKLILNEYMAVQKGWGKSTDPTPKRGGISYLIPDQPELVPLEEPQCLDLKAVSLPARLLGGDNVLSRVVREYAARDLGVFLTLYDAMGHGIETTEVNAMAASVLGEYLDSTSSAGVEKEILSPARAVRHLNGEFSRKFDGEGVFITLFAAYIDLEEAKVKYTIAGQEPPMVVRADGKVDSLLHTQLLLGIDADYKYREHQTPFGGQEVLCVFSDGLIEARNPRGDYYSRERLAAVLAESRSEPAEGIITAILRDVDRFCSGTPIEDEISILVACCLKDRS